MLFGYRMSDSAQQPIVHRHRVSTRIWHWLNAVILLVMLMSGLMILNAHPRLYWGEAGANFDHAWLEIGQRIPGWATIPSYYDLALSRRWHLTFAWFFVASTALYVLWSAVNGHLKRDLLPRGAEFRGRHLWLEVKRHARLDFPKGAEARGYNTLQKLSYFLVVVVLLPLMFLTGMAMSPGLDARWGWLTELFGGRQSARSIHFIVAMTLVVFVVVHLVMVALSGPLNEIRAMITGRYRLPQETAR